MPDAKIRAVIFDMGGVLVELGPLTDILGDDPSPAAEFWSQWLSSPVVRAFEMGRCSADEFGERLAADLGLPFTGKEMIERFRTWSKGLYSGAAELVRSIDGLVEVGVLSNTNALHWTTQVDHEEIRSLFTRTYLSYELGMVKPDAEIFQHVLDDLSLRAESVLFFDDNQENIDAARSAGLTAELCRGPDGARTVLLAHGLIR